MKYKSYKLPSHKNGGGMIDQNGNLTRNKSKAVAEIELNEGIVTSPNGDNYVLSDKLGTNKLGNMAIKFKGKDAISSKTRKILLEKAKQLNELRKNEIPSDLPEMPIGGLLSLGMQAAPMVIQGLQKLLTKDPALFSTNPNTNMYGNNDLFKMKKGGKIKKMPTGGDPLGLINSTLSKALQILPQAGIAGPTRSDFIPQTPLQIAGNAASGITQGINNVGLAAAGGKGIMNQTFDNVAGTTPQDTGSKFSVLDNIPSILHGVSAIGSAIGAFKKPEEEPIVNANFSKGDQLVTGTGIDYRPLTTSNQRQFEAANDYAKRTSSTAGQVLNRLRANSQATADANVKAITGAKQYNDQLALQRAGREDTKAVNKQQAELTANTANAQNRAMAQDNTQNFLNQLSNIGSGLDKKKYLEAEMKNMNDNQKRQFMVNLATLAAANPNFKPGNISYILDNIDSLSIDEIMNNLIQFNQ